MPEALLSPGRRFAPLSSMWKAGDLDGAALFWSTGPEPMYRTPGAGTVLLGEAGAALSAAQDRDPWRSKIGGRVVHLEGGSLAADQLHPSCGVCGRPLYLVAQVYAPVTAPRILYIFGCNRQSCNNRPGSWRVLRTQKDEEVKVEAPTPSAAEVASVETAADKPAASSGWGDGGEWDVDEGDEGEWGASAVGDEDLEAMLRQRDEALTRQQQQPPEVVVQTEAPVVAASPSSEEVPRSPDAAISASAGPCFPAFAVVDVSEPSMGGREGKQEGHRYSDDDIRARLSKYWEEEADKELVAMLQRCSSGEAEVETMAQRASSGGGAYDPEAYESASPATKAFLRFQERVSLCPRQVLRYAYGGDPLWSTHRPPREEPPVCACGKPRRFEMQLMPMLLAILRVDEHAEVMEGMAPPVTRPDDDEVVGVQVQPRGGAPGGEEGGENDDDDDDEGRRLGERWGRKVLLQSGGMDWGAVTVWSCEDSCAISHEEAVIVQSALEDEQEGSTAAAGSG